MITITIKTDNAAFDDGNRAHEVVRILRTLADKLDGTGVLRGGCMPASVYDRNGNTVGTVTLTGKDRDL